METYTIRPICTGFVCNEPKAYHFHPSTHKFYPGLGNKGELYPVFVFLVEGEGRKILVDTGMSDTERANRYHHPGSIQDEGFRIDAQIEKLGISCDGIDTVILTHMHWDHIFYMDRFKKASFIAHEKEYAFAQNPIPLYYKSYESPVLGITPPFAGLKIDTCSGETQIVPGIRVFETPGHSPGHMSVEVDTKQGKYIIGGDSAFRMDNFKPIPEIHYNITPPGRFSDMVACWRSIEITRERAESMDKILLTHDEGLLETIKTTPVLG